MVQVLLVHGVIVRVDLEDVPIMAGMWPALVIRREWSAERVKTLLLDIFQFFSHHPHRIVVVPLEASEEIVRLREVEPGSRYSIRIVQCHVDVVQHLGGPEPVPFGLLLELVSDRRVFFSNFEVPIRVEFLEQGSSFFF